MGEICFHNYLILFKEFTSMSLRGVNESVSGHQMLPKTLQSRDEKQIRNNPNPLKWLID